MYVVLSGKNQHIGFLNSVYVSKLIVVIVRCLIKSSGVVQGMTRKHQSEIGNCCVYTRDGDITTEKVLIYSNYLKLKTVFYVIVIMNVLQQSFSFRIRIFLNEIIKNVS